jgi:hypothetical protein|tara:strand:+ start:3112 stop:3738 length:627 start_codon:yes stop_codon:yes gene_type:complete
MNEVNYNFQGFIGIFENAINHNTCDKIIEHFKLVQHNNLTLNRQQIDQRIKKTEKDTLNYFLKDQRFDRDIQETIISKTDNWILDEFKNSVWGCYNAYSEKFGILNDLGKHSLSTHVKIQKSLPSQGYHMWHCESDSMATSHRMALVLMYLNDVDEGGETEFLYQSLRVKPKKGSIIICPADFSHTHRGNPPLAGEKFIITTWIEFTE